MLFPTTVLFLSPKGKIQQKYIGFEKKERIYASSRTQEASASLSFRATVVSNFNDFVLDVEAIASPLVTRQCHLHTMEMVVIEHEA